MKGSTTRQQAINLMCKQCIYDPYAKGTWKEQVRDCTSKTCPLFAYRPQPKYETPEQKEKRLQRQEQLAHEQEAA